MSILKYEFALIGYPIKHSLSPWIHEKFLEQTKLRGAYSIIEINPDDYFQEKMNELKESSLNGFNVTVPYKEKIVPFLDEIDEQAKRIGAVNTVLNQDGKWIGYNTDGIGYMRALLHKYPELANNKEVEILLLGAGGAAKGILHALLHHGYTNITIANRSLERAEALALADEAIDVLSLGEAENNIRQFGLIIQTTSVGMKPNELATIISLQSVNEAAIVSDIVYQPLQTALLKEASERGARIHYGHSMLLYQAQYAFEIWTKEKPAIEALDEQLKQVLEG